jgi:nitroreductase
MELSELIKHRRSIRKYTSQQIAQSDLEKIIEAGVYAPNAGGGQRSMIVGIHNPTLVEHIGKLNVACIDRSRLAGSYVSKEQPSIIDDPSIKSGFYGAPSVVIVFAQKNFLYSVPDAFCAEETFTSAEGAQMLAEWGVPENMVARCFVILGYADGVYPGEKPRSPGRTKIITSMPQ